jgi:hypothetical protein
MMQVFDWPLCAAICAVGAYGWRISYMATKAATKTCDSGLDRSRARSRDDMDRRVLVRRLPDRAAPDREVRPDQTRLDLLGASLEHLTGCYRKLASARGAKAAYRAARRQRQPEPA